MRYSADSELAYFRFVKRVRKKQKIWFLLDVGKDYPAYCDSNYGDKSVFPFWSDRAYAKRAAGKFDFVTKVDSIPLANFIERTLAHLLEINGLVGPNWDGDLAGREISAAEVLQALSHD